MGPHGWLVGLKVIQPPEGSRREWPDWFFSERFQRVELLGQMLWTFLRHVAKLLWKRDGSLYIFPEATAAIASSSQESHFSEPLFLGRDASSPVSSLHWPYRRPLCFLSLPDQMCSPLLSLGKALTAWASTPPLGRRPWPVLYTNLQSPEHLLLEAPHHLNPSRYLPQDFLENHLLLLMSLVVSTAPPCSQTSRS